MVVLGKTKDHLAINEMARSFLVNVSKSDSQESTDSSRANTSVSNTTADSEAGFNRKTEPTSPAVSTAAVLGNSRETMDEIDNDLECALQEEEEQEMVSTDLAYSTPAKHHTPATAQRPGSKRRVSTLELARSPVKMCRSSHQGLMMSGGGGGAGCSSPRRMICGGSPRRLISSSSSACFSLGPFSPNSASTSSSQQQPAVINATLSLSPIKVIFSPVKRRRPLIFKRRRLP